MDNTNHPAAGADFARGRIITPGTEHQLGTYGLFPPSSMQHRTLMTAGGPLAAKNAEPDLLWTSFAELCAGTVPEADYHALAGQHAAWVIDGVPAPDTDQSPQKSAAWERFGTLVGILYERDITLFLIGTRLPPDMARIAPPLSFLEYVESAGDIIVEEISGS
ncbi:cell division protein ZapE [Arthrobacter sp. CDRTa11]|uniref:AFG1/ZapE family ATPase n=1 Tax=Arthrobacter sp. CDRTa11 TaxID=2651199 RepID=UPI002265E31F|nr:AFG1/ZapE family ATPase [Arthrobacter sp. CDRTa11]UZX04045.1 cell division protein ZapE [Arthrobacter sp. CDRTa11]